MPPRKRARSSPMGPATSVHSSDATNNHDPGVTKRLCVELDPKSSAAGKDGTSPNYLLAESSDHQPAPSPQLSASDVHANHARVNDNDSPGGQVASKDENSELKSISNTVLNESHGRPQCSPLSTHAIINPDSQLQDAQADKTSYSERVLSDSNNAQRVAGVTPWRVSPALLPSYDSHVDSLRAQGVLNDLSNERVGMLRTAIVQQDLFFLIFHQLFCAWSLREPWTRCAPFFDPVHEVGFQHLQLMLSPNLRIPIQTLRFFAKFPNSFHVLQHDNSRVKTWIEQLKLFLASFNDQWHLLYLACRTSGVPPSARLSMHFHKCRDSWVFQRLFFTHLFERFYGSVSQACRNELTMLFETNQTQYQSEINMPQPNPPTDILLEPSVRAFQVLFKKIYQNHSQLPSKLHAYPDVKTWPIFHFDHKKDDRSKSKGDRPFFGPLRPPALMNKLSTAQPAQPASVDRRNHSTATTVEHTVGESVSPQVSHDIRPSSLITKTAGPEINGLRWYAVFDSFLFEPQLLHATNSHICAKFALNNLFLDRKAKEASSPASHMIPYAIRSFKNGGIIFRLRCVKFSGDTMVLSEGMWSEQPSCWPQRLFVSINGQLIEPRGSINEAPHMPADLTKWIDQNNQLEISYLPVSGGEELSYAIAMEILVCIDHATALNEPTPVDADFCLSKYPEMLPSVDHATQSSIHKDMEIVLKDPFTSRICSQPARGRHCLHRECFDLETFLRSQVRSEGDGIITPDIWQCPICSRDVRPHTLIIDGFQRQVCEKLQKDNDIVTRAINVKIDGTWKPVKPMY